jgi:hypothetical protein
LIIVGGLRCRHAGGRAVPCGHPFGYDSALSDRNGRNACETKGRRLAKVIPPAAMRLCIHRAVEAEGVFPGIKRADRGETRLQVLEVGRQRSSRKLPDERVVEAVSRRGCRNDLAGIGLSPSSEIAIENTFPVVRLVAIAIGDSSCQLSLLKTLSTLELVSVTFLDSLEGWQDGYLDRLPPYGRACVVARTFCWN